jgi:homoserine dehydrogenase
VSPSGTPSLRIALLGIGAVGSEVARALLGRSDELAAAAGGRRLELIAVGVGRPERAREVGLPETLPVTVDLADLVRDPDVDVVVELMGGLEPAGHLARAALEAGKAVVTANKALVARQGVELEGLARQTGRPLRFEAAVGGGMPILGPLAADLAADRWSAVRGIVNGSTNLVVTRMAASGDSLEANLAAAQGQGILEADPAADVEGHDAAHKLAILIRLAFGAWPEVTAIRRSAPAIDGDGPPGLLAVDQQLIAVARREALVVKMVVSAERMPDGRIAASVAPAALPESSALARTDGLENRIELRGEPIGQVAFSGPGAGGPATSSAVLGDLLALARGGGSTWAGLPPAGRLADGRLFDGMDTPRRWLTAGLPGEGGFTSRQTLDQLRAQLGGRGLRATLLPVFDEAV